MIHSLQQVDGVVVHGVSLCVDDPRHRFPAFRKRRPTPFVFTQRRQFNLRVARVGTMDSLAVVTQCLLSEPFGIPCPLRSLRPGVAIRMQRYTLDTETLATLPELRGAVVRAHSAQIWKQRAVCRERAKDFRHVAVKAHDGNRAGLFARETNDVVFPINVFSFKQSEVRL